MATLTTLSAFFAFVLLPLLILWGVLLWLSESREQRVCRLHRSGLSQRAIADQLGLTRYAVRKALAAA